MSFTAIGVTAARLPLGPFDVNPMDGSLVVVNHDGSPTVMVGSARRRLPLVVNSALWAPDGSHLVVTTDESIALLGLDGREVWRSGPLMSTGAVEIADDGRIAVATGSADAEDSVIVLDGTDGSVISTLTLPIQASRVALDPRGDEIVVATESGPPQAWNLETGQLVGSYPAEAAGEIAFSPDGAWLATMRREEQSVRLFDVGARELRSPSRHPTTSSEMGPRDHSAIRAASRRHWRSAATARCLPPRGVPVSGSLRLTSTNSWPSPVRTSLGR